MKIPTWLKTLISFILAGAIVYWSIANIPQAEWEAMLKAVKQTQWHWVFLSMVLAVLSHLSRAFRWKQMLETFKPINFGNTFSAQGVGYLVNMALPRVGEATKIGLISRIEKIGIDKVIGTVFNDRIIDVFFLFAVTAVAIFLEYPIIDTYVLDIVNALSNTFSNLNYTFLIIIGLVFLVLIGVFIKFFGTLWSKINGVLLNMLSGVKSVFNLENKGSFIFHSFFIWLMYYLMIVVCMQAMDFTSDLSYASALVLLAFGTWGFLITPGGIGAYPIVIASILALYGKDYNLSLAFGWVIWASQSLLNILMGVVSFAYLGIKKQEEEEV